MFLKRNTAGQSFVIPGSLRTVADGSAVTTGATLTVVKDGLSAPAAGELAHVAAGCYAFTPEPGECDCSIFGWVLDAPGAVAVSGSLRVTRADPDDARGLGLAGPFPADVVKVLGQPASLSDGPVAANAVQLGGQPVTATGPVTFPPEAAPAPAPVPAPDPAPDHPGNPHPADPPPHPTALPEFPAHFARLAIDPDGCVRLAEDQVPQRFDPPPAGLLRLAAAVDEKGRVKVQPIGISLVGE